MSKHYPAPWSPGSRGKFRLAIDAKSKCGHDHYSFMKIVVRIDGEDKDDPALLANAALVIASPDMLDALKSIYNRESNALIKTRQAIAKADPDFVFAD